MTKNFSQCVLEFCNICDLLYIAENETNRKDKEGLSHPLFTCLYFRAMRSKKIPGYIFQVIQKNKNILTVITFQSSCHSPDN